MSNRIIAHLDMDAFFAAIEERDHRWLKGKPIVVGADPEGGKGRGVVSTANYKARAYGIRSALPISRAWKLAEQAKKEGKAATEFLSTNFAHYAKVSLKISSLVRKALATKKITSVLEEASIDEMYFDLSVLDSFRQATLFCKNLKKQIWAQEKLTCSIGLGPNKLIAKIASDLEKPDGLTVVQEEDVKNFLEPLPIRKIPGIGPKTELFFQAQGIKTVTDLRKISLPEMENLLGKWGSELYQKIRGMDDSPLTPEHEIKSVGEQETFAQDTRAAGFVYERLRQLCLQVWERTKASGFQNFRTVVITVRFADFKTFSRSQTLAAPVNSPSQLYFEALKLITPFLDKRENPQNKALRLIGVRVEKLEV